jgi:hypothetical protein
MMKVAAVRYNPLGKYQAVYMPITDVEARALYHRGMECFDTNAEAHFWLIKNRKEGCSLILASIFEYGGYCLIGYAQI